MKEWWTAKELADLNLPGLPATERGVQTKAAAEGWKSRPRAGRGGGCEYHLSDLPTPAQVALTLAAQIAQAPAEQAAENADQPSRDQLWAWYAEAPQAKKAAAQRRLEVLDALETLYRKGGMTRDVAAAHIAQHYGVSKASIYNWLKLTHGRDRADWLPALAPRHAGSVERVECSPEAWDMLRADYLRLEAPPFADCYERMTRAAAAQGWSYPSERTLLRRLQVAVHPAVMTLARQGREALKRMYPAQERDRSHFEALQAINGDGHKWDVWVEWPDGAVSRPNMVAFQDLYSGMILAWRVDKTANSWAVRLAIGDLIEVYGVPRACWLDNGRDFASKWLTGGVPNRYRFTVREEEPAGILTNLGVEIHWTTPYSGQSKPIERAFRDLASDIARHPALAGAYTGNSPTTKPENYKSRAVKLDDFLALLTSEINQHNDRQGRKAANCRGRSFRETFDESYATAATPKATEEQRRLWLLAAEGVDVSSRDGSIKLMGNRYFAEFLHLHRGEKVAARFDPDYLHDGLHVYRLDGAYLGHAPVIEAAGFDSAEAATAHNRARKAWMRAARQMKEAEVRMSAAKVAELVPFNLGPAAPPEARVVALARPTLDLKQTPKAEPLSEGQQARHAALIHAFKAAPAAVRDEKTVRLERAARISADLAAGRAVSSDEAEWFERYQNLPEWRAHQQMQAFSAIA
ncbi:MAG TPA: transposase domain-containing protein [Azospirillaceae bacterium]|nr:transposase domain-containing protein [Azospirillaceae bacterium]HRQ81346.1 transposase domain-containing protein [Azospirillaceae bacterium]